MYIDSHVHYAHKRFNGVREVLLSRLHAEGLEMAVEAAITIESNLVIQEVLEPYPWIKYSVGLHPGRVESSPEKDREAECVIEQALCHPKVVAIGETGLDYHRLCYDTEENRVLSEALKERQEYWFDKQLVLAKERNLPLIIHTRDAYERTVEIMKQHVLQKVPGVIHCFRGDRAAAQVFLEMGFYLGLGGAITYESEESTREAVKAVPLERILLETDSPFLAPEGCGGAKNTSGNIPQIAAFVGELKGIRGEEIMEISNENTKELFGIV